jgi:hypothetical protein
MPRLDIGKPSYKSTANNERLAMPRCFLTPRTQLCIHALIGQGLPLHAIYATARERIALDVDGPRGHL